MISSKLKPSKSPLIMQLSELLLLLKKPNLTLKPIKQLKLKLNLPSILPINKKKLQKELNKKHNSFSIDQLKLTTELKLTSEQPKTLLLLLKPQF